MGGGGTRKKDFQHLVSEHLVLPYHCLLDSIRVPIQCTTQGDSLSSRSLTAVGGTQIFIWSGGWNHRSCCSVAHSLHYQFFCLGRVILNLLPPIRRKLNEKS